jgi:DNA-binding MurR/RpiR family transcriptional regulator
MMDPYQRNGVTAMRHDFLATLQEKAPSFSKGQRRIAAYITESYDKAAFMTANRLGKVVGVSESTVVRFAMELGFDGYPGMQKAMQEMVVNRLTASQRIEVANDRIGDQDVVSMVLQSDADKLRQTGETVDRGEFQAAVNAILNAKRVYILGVRSAATLAGFLGYYLNYMFRDVHVVTASGAIEMFEKIVGVGPEDVVIAFSFPRYSTTTAKGAQYCRPTGATVIGMTDSRLSPLGQNCDHVLLVKSDMVSLVDSLVAPLSVTNALIVAIAARREKELSKTFDNLEHIWEEYNVYEKQEDQP